MEISQRYCPWVVTWMEAIQTEANGQMEAIVMDESNDAIECKGLCQIY